MRFVSGINAARGAAYVASAFLTFLSPLIAQAAITVSITNEAVTAQGVTPGAGAVFFGVAHDPHTAYHTIRHFAEYVADDDSDGTIAFRPGKGVSWKSVWFVVDAESGAYVQAAPADFPVTVAAMPGTVPKREGNGEWSALIHERSWLELLVIRPRAGVWQLTAMRGGVADTEHKHEPTFATPIELFRAITPRVQPLNRLKKGDIVIGIDVQQVAYFVMEVE